MSTLRKAMYFDKRFVDKPWEVMIGKAVMDNYFKGHMLSNIPFGKEATETSSCLFPKDTIIFVEDCEVQSIPENLKEEYKKLFV